MLWRTKNAAVSTVSCPCYSCRLPPAAGNRGAFSARWPNARPKGRAFLWKGESHGRPPVKVASSCQRIRTNLELDHLGPVSLAGFAMERRAVSVSRPDAAALPAPIRIVDTAVHPLGKEAERIRHPHIDPLAVHPRHQRLVGIAGSHRNVGAEAGRVELVDPGIIARLGAAAFGDIPELRSRERNERPPFRTQLAFGGLRPVERALAFAAIELAHVAARQWHIGDAVAINIEAARPEPRERRLIHFRQPRLGVVPDHIVRIAENGTPDRAVHPGHP